MKEKSRVSKPNLLVKQYGGAVPMYLKMIELGIVRAIKSNVEGRVPQAQYSYDEVIVARILSFLCNGVSLRSSNDINKNLSLIPNLPLPSPYTQSRICTKLSEPTVKTYNVSKTKKTNLKSVETQTNYNRRMNEILVKATVASKILPKKTPQTLHIDCVYQSTTNRGAVRKLDKNGKVKHSKVGYQMMVCMIDNVITNLSVSDGYAGASNGLAKCIENNITLLNESKVIVGRVISDAAGASKEVCSFLHNKKILYNMRMPYRSKSKGFNKGLKTINDWKPVEIKTTRNVWNCQIGEFPYQMYAPPRKQKPHRQRIVVIRKPTLDTLKKYNPEEYEREMAVRQKLSKLAKEGKLKYIVNPKHENHWKEIGGFLYKFFVTNDFHSSLEKIVLEYNSRGATEGKFSYMNNDFGWKHIPFEDMAANTVFMILACLSNNIFRAMVKLFKDDIPIFTMQNRLKTVLRKFISTSYSYCKKIKKYTFYNDEIPFEKIM